MLACRWKTKGSSAAWQAHVPQTGGRPNHLVAVGCTHTDTRETTRNEAWMREVSAQQAVKQAGKWPKQRLTSW